MLTIEKSKEMLNRDGLNYTDEEVKQIREFIYILAEIDYQLFKRKQDERLNQFQSENKTEVEKEKQAEKVKFIPNILITTADHQAKRHLVIDPIVALLALAFQIQKILNS